MTEGPPSRSDSQALRGRDSWERPRGPLALEDTAVGHRAPQNKEAPCRAAAEGAGQGSDGRKTDGLTAAEREALGSSALYNFPMRYGPTRVKILASPEYEEYGLEESESVIAVELTEQNSETRKQKMTDFFDRFVLAHRDLGLYAKWATLGGALGGAEKDLWTRMDKGARDLPFHATPEMWRSPAGRFMSCRRKDESDPLALLRNLLTDGRAVYCVYFSKEETLRTLSTPRTQSRCTSTFRWTTPR